MDMIEGRMLRVHDAIYAYQLNGKGGVDKIEDNCQASMNNPCWLHLDYESAESMHWLKTTPLLTDNVRVALLGESTRPRITRFEIGTLITLRAINFNQHARPDQMVIFRVFIRDNLIISTRHRKVYSIDEVVNALKEDNGPVNCGSWLVEICEALTDDASEFIDELHDKVVDLEDALLERQTPERGKLALIRKQLIVLRRYLAPQRDIFSRLANERFIWMNDDDRYRMQDIAERQGRGLDELDGCIARTSILSDEITSVTAEAMNRRTYTMSLLAMIFLPTTFLTGLFGVNLGGIPGNNKSYSFAIFCLLIIVLAGVMAWWLKRSRWL